MPISFLRPLRFALVLCGFLAALPAAAQTRSVDPALAQRLQAVMGPLLQHMNRPIPPSRVKIGIMADPQINAANAGGGEFFVTTGLLQRANDNQLRAILAHEIAHADLGHVAHQQALNVGVGLGVALLEQLWPGSSQFTPIAGQLLSNAYSRGEEKEADAHGVEILRRAGYDGKRMMIDTLSWLQRGEPDGGGFFSTHPKTGDRIAELQRVP